MGFPVWCGSGGARCLCRVNAGCVHITLDAGRVDHSADHCPVNRATVLRLTLPIPIAQVLAVSLYDFLKQRGLAPSPDHGH